MFEILQIRRRLILAGRHQHSVAAQIVVFASDHDLPVIFVADEFGPLGGLLIGIADISFVHGPRPGQGIVDHRDFVMKNIAVFLVDEDAFLEEKSGNRRYGLGNRGLVPWESRNVSDVPRRRGLTLTPQDRKRRLLRELALKERERILRHVPCTSLKGS